MRRGGWRREGVLDTEEVAVEGWKGVLGGGVELTIRRRICALGRLLLGRGCRGAVDGKYRFDEWRVGGDELQRSCCRDSPGDSMAAFRNLSSPFPFAAQTRFLRKVPGPLEFPRKLRQLTIGVCNRTLTLLLPRCS